MQVHDDGVQAEKWWPSSYLDEVSPAPRPSPNEWLVTLDDGDVALDDHRDEYDRDGEAPIYCQLFNGEVVAFTRLVIHGLAQMTVSSDGAFTLSDPEPEEAEMVWLPGDGETISPDAKTLALALAESVLPGEPETFDIELYSLPESLWHFDAASGAFTRVADAESDEKAEAASPDWDDLRGIAPDATGDQSSEDFIRDQRDSWPTLE